MLAELPRSLAKSEGETLSQDHQVEVGKEGDAEVARLSGQLLLGVFLFFFR